MLGKTGLIAVLLLTSISIGNAYAAPLGGSAAYFLSEICMKYENPAYQGDPAKAVKESPEYEAWPVKKNLDVALDSFNKLSNSEKSECSKYQDDKLYSLTQKEK